MTTNLLKILAKLLWCNLFCVIRTQNFRISPQKWVILAFLVNQKLRQKYPVDHRHNCIKVSPLRSPTNSKKGIFSKKIANRLKIVFK